MSQIQVLGIDLGTANSVVAGVNQLGHAVVLRDREGQLAIPSMVLFDDERTIVGEEARLRGKRNPHRLAACVKREMGREFYSQPIGQMRLPPEVIQACILNKLRTEMARFVAPNVGVVIGVPANFNDVQRRVTAEAGEMAGWRVLDVLNEPVAAALAFAEHTPDTNPGGKPVYLLVYDLGGYTFETTLLEYNAGTYTMLGTLRSEHLGGHDWDARLVDYFAEQFKARHGVDLKANPVSLGNLIQLASKTKLALSLRHATSVLLEQAGHSLELSVTRGCLTELTQDLLTQTTEMSEQLLQAANLTWMHLSRVLLVGGATRMPTIRNLIKHKTCMEPDVSVNPEEAVARGTAIYAAHLAQAGAKWQSKSTLKINNVNTHSLGIEGVDAATGRRTNRILIKRNTPLPVQVKRDFAVKASEQHSITITVLEGESSDPDQCVTIGRAILRDLPIEMNQDWPVEVTYLYEANGRIQVDARVRYTNKAVHLEMTRLVGLSATHRERWKTAVMAAGGIASYRQVLLNNVREEKSTPIALADSNPPQDAAADSSSANVVLSFLKRIVPFAFRSQTNGTPNKNTDEREPSATGNPTTATNKTREPPTLELLD